ncbi:beta-propeller repeat-containing protein [Flavobacterium sp. 9]|uniref:SBBP repeat-containing protein n=1 Tax=Flavobacterium sp. 9 TaxID=2035198 RepID=UPI000C69A2E9|nr:SBBP repeat-containing protein [Flavobacterium sp. 9]PIF34256.1 beta-propeller repeat-containing protein [Flavobacterium sp. 9]
MNLKTRFLHRLLLPMFLFIFMPVIQAQTSLQLNWINPLESNALFSVKAKSVKTDASGNIYLVGNFTGTTDFDPSEGIANLTSAGEEDVFVAKYDINGKYIYACALGGIEYDNCNALAVDRYGNAYITGSFKDKASFNSKKKIIKKASAGDFDIFIAKYDPDGRLLYANTIGGKERDYGQAITADDNGNVYVTGYFAGICDFDLGKGTANLSSQDGVHLFFAKYDANGEYVYAKNINGNSSGIANDDKGNIYLTGYYEGTADFDPGKGVEVMKSIYDENIFFAKYDSYGNFVFVKNIGSERSKDESRAIALDRDNNIYLTGFFEDDADFDPGIGTAILSTPEPCGMFLAKYNAEGDYIYAKSMSGGRGVIGNAIAVDSTGNAYVTGYFEGTVDFDPSAEIAKLTSPGQTKESTGYEADIFLAKYDTKGNYIYAKSMGGKDYDKGHGIALTTDGRIYLAGTFESPTNFDPVNNTNFVKLKKAIYGAFLASYSECNVNENEIIKTN